ncbi:MAG: hypothetical protein EZS28_055424 [Streblomastix strix]|uniref:Uncharacterized protein n=1 Tax=Streblomastix strix TaxID=222440 RepID=A0A5J4Q1R0_9EUKA|nr:MAG: hypothetical protein EZS28_055424 [Streblomastix strix]
MQLSKFKSLVDQKVDQEFVITFEVAMKMLIEEISQYRDNIIFPMPEVGTLLREEGPRYAQRSLESAVAVIQGMAMLINDAARNETNNLVEKMLKVFEASPVSVDDSQIERES